MKLLLIVLIILLILLIPIPLKFNIYYSTKDYYIKFYKFTLISKQKILVKKENRNISNKDNIHKKEVKKQNKFLSKNFKSLLSIMYKLKFRPLLKIKFTLDYSLNDATKTAIFYGILSQLPEIIYSILSVPFKQKKYTFDINPIFRDEFLLKFEISSIISLSFAHIIYILIIIFRSIIVAREVNPS